MPTRLPHFICKYRKRPVLVVGSVHLDIYATHTDDEIRYEDRPGEVRLSWGGCALNVAINLSDRYRVKLNSVAYMNEQITSSLTWLLKRAGAHSEIEFIKPTERDVESIQCHVAITSGKSVREAVTQTLVEHREIESNILRSLRRRPGLVIADTNLSVSQLRFIIGVCTSQDIPLIVVGVTQQKAPRFVKALKNSRLYHGSDHRRRVTDPPEIFDCFLSHNSADKPTVRVLAQNLRARGISVWLDEEQLRPGILWQPLLEAGIRSSRSVAVLVGRDGLGPWESEEMRAALSLAVRDGRPVIPVLLADAPAQPQLPLFLGERTWVDLRSRGQANGDSELDRLVWGITGNSSSYPSGVSGNTVSDVVAQNDGRDQNSVPKSTIVFICNDAEYKEVQREIANQGEPNIDVLRERLTNLVVTHNRSGYSLYSKAGEAHDLPPPQISSSSIRFDSGAGDATACAIAACLLEDGIVTPKGMETWVQHYVPRVLGTFTAHAIPETNFFNRALAMLQCDPNRSARVFLLALLLALVVIFIELMQNFSTLLL